MIVAQEKTCHRLHAKRKSLRCCCLSLDDVAASSPLPLTRTSMRLVTAGARSRPGGVLAARDALHHVDHRPGRHEKQRGEGDRSRRERLGGGIVDRRRDGDVGGAGVVEAPGGQRDAVVLAGGDRRDRAAWRGERRDYRTGPSDVNAEFFHVIHGRCRGVERPCKSRKE